MSAIVGLSFSIGELDELNVVRCVSPSGEQIAVASAHEAGLPLTERQNSGSIYSACNTKTEAVICYHIILLCIKQGLVLFLYLKIAWGRFLNSYKITKYIVKRFENMEN